MKKVAYISKNSVLCKRGVFMREKNKYQRMTKTIQSCSKGTATCSCGSKDFKVTTLR